MKRPNDITDGSEEYTCKITVDGKTITAFKNEMLLHTLFAYGMRKISLNDHNQINGAYCSMGICHLCTVRIDGRSKRRACMTPVKEGMIVETQSNLHYMKDFGIKKNPEDEG